MTSTMFSTSNRQTNLNILHPKGGNFQRKALTDIKNVHQPKTVSFETSKQSIHSMKKINDKDCNVFTPGPKILKSTFVTPAGAKSNNKVKIATSTFKIFDDSKNTQNVERRIKLSKNKHQEPDEIEYLAPNNDADYKIKLPDYVEKAMNYQPTYNMTFSKDDSLNLQAIVTNLQHQIFEKSNYDIPDQDLLTLISETSITDEELLWNIENDSAFSLDMLDEELRY
ncbi:uncharacterized protein LOC101241831 isoform X2 [Hydra vulgaris]|uniref:Uncharacterized protein LOC101241831 isoform X2 n=1 Tax=Hydra vulgaris TaxID=6087 RepID=A0ABM4DE26_HYDVU